MQAVIISFLGVPGFDGWSNWICSAQWGHATISNSPCSGNSIWPPHFWHFDLRYFIARDGDGKEKACSQHTHTVRTLSSLPCHLVQIISFDFRLLVLISCGIKTRTGPLLVDLPSPSLSVPLDKLHDLYMEDIGRIQKHCPGRKIWLRIRRTVPGQPFVYGRYKQIQKGQHDWVFRSLPWMPESLWLDAWAWEQLFLQMRS